MEAVLLQYSSQDQPISPYKSHLRTPKSGINRSLIARPSENTAPLSLHSGIIQTPPPFLSHSYPPFSVQQKPPLLPLPISRPMNNIIIPPRVRGLSCPPTNRKANNNNRPRESSLTPRKSKPQATTGSKKEEKLKPVTAVGKASSPPKEGFPVSSTKPLGPDPKDLPKNVSKILALSLSRSNTIDTTNTFSSLKVAMKDEVDEFSGSAAFSISPPPSSLPLPTFSLRPKLSCNAEAAGVDAGATDDLRRLLRLR